MTSASQANLSSADGSGALRERAPGALRPSRGAEDVYAQARTLFRAMVQLPHYAEEVRVQSVRRGIIYLRFGLTAGRSYTAANCQKVVKYPAKNEYAIENGLLRILP